jgi:hypothetical protein
MEALTVYKFGYKWIVLNHVAAYEEVSSLPGLPEGATGRFLKIYLVGGGEIVLNEFIDNFHQAMQMFASVQDS